MSALDELLRSWRANPDAEATIALCTTLGRAKRPDLMGEVRGVVEQWHGNDAGVLVRLGLMFLEAGALIEAQAAFVSAGKADGTNPEAFRYLGEVLLRRGDAARADKVLERALRLDPSSPELRLWHERARMFVSLQSRVGLEAVAKEVARTVPSSFSDPPPPLPTRGGAPGSGGASRGFSQGAVPRGAPPASRPRESALRTLPDPPQPFAEAPSTTPPSPSGGAPPPVHGGSEAAFPGRHHTPASHQGRDDASAEEILSQLALVGVFEGGQESQPQWERAPRERNRSLWVLAGAAVLVAGAAVGGVDYARSVAERKTQEAAALCDEVAAELRTGRREAIASTDERLSRVFELDPNSPRAARLWLENRVMHWLVRGASEGIEGAIQRQRRLGASPEEVAFGTLAVRLAEGDVPGALGVLARADDQAKGDPLYQLLAGLALERVGDARCLQRYESAIAGDARLRIARVLRARALLSMRGAAEAEDVLQGIEPSSVEGKALALLGAALAPMEEAQDQPATGLDGLVIGDLPVVLRWIPSLWRARSAISAGGGDEVEALIEEALETVDTPDAAVRIGELALAADSPALVRQAALRAMSLSAVHEPARLLAARAAVDMGRYDEGLRAIEGIDTKHPAALSLRAVAAYERGDAVALGDASDALRGTGEAADAQPAVALLPALLVGGRLPRELPTETLSRPEALWGRLVLADAALLRGQTQRAAERIAALPPDSAAVARRLAQLARLGGRTDDALKHSARALDGSPTAPALIERVLCLLNAKRVDEAREAVTARGSLLGPLAPWLAVLADIEQGVLPRAKARAATLPEPPAESPLVLRLAVARALVGLGDRARGGPLLAQVRRQAPRHPEVSALPARL